MSLAAREGKEKVVRILLKIPSIDVNIGQEENSKLPNGFNALQWASILGHQGVVKVNINIIQPWSFAYILFLKSGLVHLGVHLPNQCLGHE